MQQRSPFRSIYSHGFARAAVCIPYVRVADPNFNAEHTLGLAQRASDLGAGAAVSPTAALAKRLTRVTTQMRRIGLLRNGEAL